MKTSIFKIQQTLLAVLLLLSLAVSSCKKYVDLQVPPSSLEVNAVFTDSATATSAILAIYAGIASAKETGTSANTVVYGSSTYGSMSADDGYFPSYTAFDPLRNNTLTAGNTLLSYWSGIYTRLYRVNFAITGLDGATGISARLKDQLTGEAKFMRAWLYFQLINYFGDVPLVLSTAAATTSQQPRAATAAVYQQILTDLTDAKNLLTTQYPSTERARINKHVVSAFLARVYFYQQNWQQAEAEASTVIGSGVYSLVQDLDKVFLNSSNETIWQISTVTTTTPATVFGAQYLPAAGVAVFVLYDTLANSFEANDLRKQHWAQPIVQGGKTYYYPYKYKLRDATASTEYPVMLRLSEMLLIRAEALAQQNNLTDARRDLDSVRHRAGLPSTTATTQTTILKALEHERWVELFTENGDRWFNLKRLNKATEALSPIKPSWQAYQQLYPIPQSAMQSNRNLKDNEGYF